MLVAKSVTAGSSDTLEVGEDKCAWLESENKWLVCLLLWN